MADEKLIKELAEKWENWEVKKGGHVQSSLVTALIHADSENLRRLYYGYPKLTNNYCAWAHGKTAEEHLGLAGVSIQELYYFEQLSDEAKENARSWWRNCDTLENEDLEEDFKERLKEVGLPYDNVKYRLSYSQGDGVAFYGDIDSDNYLKLAEKVFEFDTKKLRSYKRALKYGAWDACLLEIVRNNYGYHYSHSKTMTYNWDLGGIPDSCTKISELWERFCDLVLVYARDISSELEKTGYEEIEYQNSDEFIDDCLVANEYTFMEDGERED